jgi:hypothetical protein
MLRTSWITLSLVIFLAALAGCSDVPDHNDAWLSFKYGIHCGSYGNCKELTNFNEATAYYQTIGVADPTSYTLDNWFSENGFVSGADVTKAVYANLGDLQIGRGMNCVQVPVNRSNLPAGLKVACYVNNFGPLPTRLASNPFGDTGWPNIKEALAEADGSHPATQFATVAMVYDSTIVGPNNVTFYGFNGDGHLVLSVALDGADNASTDKVEAGPKTVPRMCMACHGGRYDTNTHSVTAANFLPFDVFYFRYSGKDGFTFDEQAEAFRKLNTIVASTTPAPAIQEFINGTYPGGVNIPNSAAVDGFIPDGWKDNAKLYQGVVRQYCRMCHMAQPESFAKSSDFVGFVNQIQHEVCETHDMPHAQVPFGVDGRKIGFWKDNVAQHDLGNFFHSQGVSSCLPHD